MKTAGIIAEYNPFHNGHYYHIEETRRLTGADHVVVVMSGSFTQRGTPALIDKYTRTRMALLGGADLVLELPVLFSAGSAGDFAFGAVSLLDKLGAIDLISFGSEAGSHDVLLEAAAILSREPALFQDTLRTELQNGSSYAKARFAALNAVLPTPLPSGPNNLLGLEYCHALIKRNSRILPFTITRQGAGYHDPAITGTMPSALSIRKYLETSGDSGITDLLSASVPKEVLGLWEELTAGQQFLFPSDFTKELRYKLLCLANEDLTVYADITRELSDKIRKSSMHFSDWEHLCSLVKSKELTYSRISRALCHILLDITANDLQTARDTDYVPYARILGFRKSAQPLLSQIKKNTRIPMISKLADAPGQLSPQALSVLQKDISAAHICESVLAAKTGQPLRNEYTRQIVILP